MRNKEDVMREFLQTKPGTTQDSPESKEFMLKKLQLEVLLDLRDCLATQFSKK